MPTVFGNVYLPYAHCVPYEQQHSPSLLFLWLRTDVVQDFLIRVPDMRVLFTIIPAFLHALVNATQRSLLDSLLSNLKTKRCLPHLCQLDFLHISHKCPPMPSSFRRNKDWRDRGVKKSCGP